MSLTVPRTCTEIGDNGQRTPNVPLAQLRDCPAFVLLGEPGAGKTTSFQQEALAAGTESIAARDFISLGPKPEWQGKTLFIDGLDEIRAGETNRRTPLDEIRKKLDSLGRPPFRLSCREADWFGASDNDALARVSPTGSIAVFHLDPLSQEQIERLLAEKHGVADTNAFVEQAKKARLDALLGNPQTLGMLANAVKDDWPDSLGKTYDLACHKLAEEPNKTHRDAQRGEACATDEILDAAGHICAIQLLAGIAGYALDADAADSAHPTFAEIGVGNTAPLRQAIVSRLFEAGGNEERREPTHRSVAEYLAARFLAKRINSEGLPLGRIQALMTAGDGGVVSDLRGLHAWLAVHCPSARSALIDEDPLGIVLYGDVRSFGADSKRRLLQALGREAERYAWFRSQDWTDHPFGALADRSMLSDLETILLADERNATHESLLDCVLEALTHGMPLPELGEPLLAIVRDPRHWERNRHAAIDAYRNVCPEDHAPLLAILTDIQSGAVVDPSDELAGMLLQHLYPEHVPVSDVLSYLHPAKNHNLIGAYRIFWEHTLFDKTGKGDWAVLLDHIANSQAQLRFSPDDFRFRRFVGELLTQGLDSDGDTVAVEHLWSWLAVGLDEHDISRLEQEHENRIAEWLTARPSIYVALLDIALRECGNHEKPIDCMSIADDRLHEATLPPEAEEWCFANASASDDKDVRRYLCNKGLYSLVGHLNWTPILLDTLLGIGSRFPGLQANIDEWLACPWDTRRQDSAQRKVERSKEAADRIADWRRHFHKNRSVIEAGTASPAMMHNLAMVYFGRFREAQGDTPKARIRSFFGESPDFEVTTLTGLRSTLNRNDLPSVSEIVDLASKGQHHYIAVACLAGVEELFANESDAIPALPVGVQKRLVAFQLAYNFDNASPWFLTLLAKQPAMIAETLVAYGKAMFKARKEHVAGISALAYEAAYSEVAGQSVLPLLASFPLRCKKEQLSQLATLLIAAIKHADRTALLNLIATKLSRPSIDKAQCSHWLAAGLMLDPERYERPLSYVGKNQSRAIQVATFFDSRLDRIARLPEYSESAISLLIRLLAPHVSPERPKGAHKVTAAHNAADLVRSLISRLGSKPTATATEAIDSLLSLSQLQPWHGELRHRKESQRLVSREASFQRADAATITKVLANGAPANASDLRELLIWHLRDIARLDRDAAGTGYLRYWNVDSHGRPKTARPENDCRDRLLEFLREKLRPTEIDLQPEGQYHEHKRADIRASFGGVSGFNVPVEIKRDRHADLWKAMRAQLMAHYAIEPGADGNGIYLVLWFGGQAMPPASDGGPPPNDAHELESRLRNTLAANEQRRIDVIVVDCAPT